MIPRTSLLKELASWNIVLPHSWGYWITSSGLLVNCPIEAGCCWSWCCPIPSDGTWCACWCPWWWPNTYCTSWENQKSCSVVETAHQQNQFQQFQTDWADGMGSQSHRQQGLVSHCLTSMPISILTLQLFTLFMGKNCVSKNLGGPNYRSPTLLDGFKSELAARKDAINNAKLALESSYAKTLGKTEKVIQEDGGLVSEINGHIAKIEAAFNSFNGTIKSIKTAIDSSLISVVIVSHFFGLSPLFYIWDKPH